MATIESYQTKSYVKRWKGRRRTPDGRATRPPGHEMSCEVKGFASNVEVSTMCGENIGKL